MTYGHNIQVSVDSFLNTVQYPAEIPEYSVAKAQALRDGILEPWYIPDRNSMVLSRMTIAMMIDFVHRVIPFRIMLADDMIEIDGCLKEYIMQLSEFAGMAEADEFLLKANNFAKKLDRSINNIATRDPKLMKKLRNNALANIFKTNIPLKG